MRVPVVNMNSKGFKEKKGDVYIGRPRSGRDGRYGNPYLIGRDGTREEVILKFALEVNEDLVKDLIKQKPKRLMCFCAPQACHGDIYAELMEVLEYHA
jgi:hypothetical protein